MMFLYVWPPPTPRTRRARALLWLDRSIRRVANAIGAWLRRKAG